MRVAKRARGITRDQVVTMAARYGGRTRGPLRVSGFARATGITHVRLSALFGENPWYALLAAAGLSDRAVRRPPLSVEGFMPRFHRLTLSLGRTPRWGEILGVTTRQTVAVLKSRFGRMEALVAAYEGWRVRF